MAAPDFQKIYPKADIGDDDGIVTTVPETTVVDGSSVGITPTHRLHWIILTSSDDADLLLGTTKASVEAGHGWPFKADSSIALNKIGGTRRFVIGAPSGGGNGKVSAIMSEKRRSIGATVPPELTVANSFPEYDGSDTDNIVPGVPAA
jgi:hypothetical protein